MDIIRSTLVFLILFSVVFTTKADHANFEKDEFWQKRAQEANVAARQAYQRNPMSVTDNLNEHVHRSINGGNHTRRDLKSNILNGCMATNPIDQCWRCQKNWDRNRKKLADCVLGFGRKTTGGKAGKIYIVNDPSDNDLVNPKKGTLRHALLQPQPLWVIFARDMSIRLSEELIMTGNKTIDGRGAQVHIANGAGLTLQYISNVIIHNIRVHDIKKGNGGMIRDSLSHFGLRTKSDGDGISIFGSTNVWIDHVSMSHCDDGLIDVVEASTAVTISNCHFAHHNEVMLFGATNGYEKDKIMQVTLAFNHFGKGLKQRMPRVRYGYVHIVNNLYTKWQMYAIGGSHGPTILSQGNEFTAPNDRNAKEVTKRDYAPESVWKNWVWRSERDVMRNGAFFKQTGDPKHKFASDSMVKPKHGKFASKLAKFAGPLKCIKNKAC